MEYLKNCKLPILLVDDEPALLYSEKVILRAAGASEVMTFNDGLDVLPFLSTRAAAVVVLDLIMPGIAGEELLAQISEKFPDLPVIIVTAKDRVDSAVQCMKSGAMDYIVKPFEEGRFLLSVEKALEVRALKEEVLSLQRYLLDDKPADPSAFSEIITADPKMKAVFCYMEAVANSPRPVLITGETGVGKELVAAAIHKLSGRSGEFVAVNVAGLDDNMFSDTLFGHRKGAFTGAVDERAGLVSQASGGTLFLDEIGDMDAASQIKLLRLLQAGQYYHLGSDAVKKTDARIVVATNKDLTELRAGDKFREDLYYRLRTHHIHIPPLRERPSDITLLVEHFLEAASSALGRNKPGYHPQLIKDLSAYSFPGNVRELQAMVFDAVTQNKSGMVSIADFATGMSEEIYSAGAEVAPQADSDPFVELFGKFPTLEEMEGYMIEQAMKYAGKNQGKAATILGISRQKLNQMINKGK